MACTLDSRGWNERIYMKCTVCYKWSSFIQSFYILHIILIVLNLCSHIYKYLHTGVDSTVFQYLILYPKLVRKVKTYKTLLQYFGVYSPAGKRREISVICEADVKSVHKWDLHTPICNKRENYILSKNKFAYGLIHPNSLLYSSLQHLL